MVQIGFKCNRGLVRENNEDACFVIPSHDVYIVADGVGGNKSGEVASRTAVSEIAQLVSDAELKKLREPEEIFGFFSGAVEKANETIYRLGTEKEENRGMATTVVIAYIAARKAYITNIGDSRAYLFRKGKLKRITKDHTYVNELIEKGVITEHEAENHKQKNVITRALGAERHVEPDFYKVGLSKDDILMLCSDGLYGEVKDDKMLEILSGDGSMNDICSELVEEAIGSGGRDNITVVCMKI
ncbi:MAG TPA: Stp1/IreP family PP2C-type Ser/Thr phosphatase [Candidatus Copromorpha excrementigallinarum]|uniref:Stp1/IreP family PP2C-type Ser/Thr phosphatase n=1 Tax=Candidatus Allocopromorpha excrementigallinarum TaxID=2840742 RepID=A0A9D1I0L6_9FIRM|nr:Stp1/IreP family PP2C-type Ser/Thr phosphatase [Candidatus Copromorpha excrementigallinarum]